MQEEAYFTFIRLVPGVRVWGIRSRITDHQTGNGLFQIIGVPPTLRWDSSDLDRISNGEVGRRAANEVNERFERGFRLSLTEVMKDHADVKCVFGLEYDAFTPLPIEQVGCVKVCPERNQAAKCSIGLRPDCTECHTAELRDGPCAKRHARGGAK